MSNVNRRDFLKSASAMAVSAGLLGKMASKKAFANELEGYKALVCVFFFGGLDQNDTILPRDQASYDLFTAQRSELMATYQASSTSSSRHIDNLLPLVPKNTIDTENREYGLPPELQALHELFNNDELAIVGSVGPLVEPTTRTQFEQKSTVLPKRLFSHNDQQSTWMALNIEGATVGWGGRLLDATLRSDATLNKTFMGISTSNTNTFLTGQLSSSFNVSSTGSVRVNPVERRGLLGDSTHYDEARNRLMAFFEQKERNSQNIYEQDAAAFKASGVTNGTQFSNAFANVAPSSNEFPSSSLGKQLKTVAQTISVRDQLNTKRQVFFVGIGGFDSHSDQATTVPALQTQIAEAIKAFRDAMIEQNTWNDVTLFTASDFGRTLNDNGDGTDHGWAGHHFVVGGSVQGGNIYGHLPSSDPTSGDYTDKRGRLIPKVSVEQYAATLGNWFGLDQAQLNAEFPNLVNFTEKNLGFMA